MVGLEKMICPNFSTPHMLIYTSEYEGFGLPILEAMACGIPVVASNSASIPEIVGKAGKLVDLNDEECVKEFAEAILQILESNIKIDRRALERSMEFDWEKTARETLEIYTEVL
ncbi:MAG: glycosyltransferase [Candidatus Methanoglobus sp.]